MQLGKRHFKLRSKASIALLLAALVLLLDAMAACPALHELIHKDAGQAEHQCGVTLFAHGQVDSATVDVPVIASALPIAITPQVVFSIFSPAIQNLPAGRAPPVLPAVA
ncbi:MAG TPA: hypothetical protein VG347_09625 [Verrucomicrobiae bacterium]|nr:hypothetical protein [Verrucomicrobiae bacterium]